MFVYLFASVVLFDSKKATNTSAVKTAARDMNKERQAVIVGVGRYTHHNHVGVNHHLSPVEMVKGAALRAALDASGSKKKASALLRDVIAIATPETFTSRNWWTQFHQRQFTNFSRCVADAISANPKPKHCILAAEGGNAPQFLVNMFGELLSKNEVPQGPILIGGMELNATFKRNLKSGKINSLQDQNGWTDCHAEKIEFPTMVNVSNKYRDATERKIAASEYFHLGKLALSPPPRRVSSL